MASKFHTWGAEFRDNKSSDDDEPIFVASDASLDEGAVIRTTAPSGSPLAGPVQYFVGMDSAEAAATLAALTLWIECEDDPDNQTTDFGIEEVEMMRNRVARAVAYMTGGQS